MTRQTAAAASDQLTPARSTVTAPADHLGPLLGAGRTAEVFGWGATHVLKLYRAEMPRAWVEDEVRREARIAHLVTAAGLPAPVAGGALVEVEGRLGIVYTRMDGPSMLDAMAQQPAPASVLAITFGDLHAAMHGCSAPALPAQRATLTHAIDHAPALTAPQKQRAQQRLAQLTGGDALCHGDFHPGNILLTAQGPVIIDWVTACRGNPVADVARTTLLFRIARAPVEDEALQAAIDQARQHFYAAYISAYQKRRPFASAHLDAWLPVLAAARLSEQIDGEEEPLLEMVGAL